MILALDCTKRENKKTKLETESIKSMTERKKEQQIEYKEMCGEEMRWLKRKFIDYSSRNQRKHTREKMKEKKKRGTHGVTCLIDALVANLHAQNTNLLLENQINR